jgi:hypothetical protein
VEKEWSNKPMDLHPLGVIHDHRIYQCQGCGDRYTDDQVNEVGGVCPKDGAILRPLGHYEETHKGLWSGWWRKSS